MEVRHAAAQIDAIFNHVARTQEFRGYRPLTVAATGVMGLIAAAVQPFVVPVPLVGVYGYVDLWIAVAVVSVLVVGIELAISYRRAGLSMERQLTKQAVQQFAPCLIAGGFITWLLADFHPEKIALLPGLWALCFSLGIFASIPFMTPKIMWVAAYYLCAGALSLYFGQGELALSPWLMGLSFGVGQLLMAGVLYFSEDRRDAEA